MICARPEPAPPPPNARCNGRRARRRARGPAGGSGPGASVRRARATPPILSSPPLRAPRLVARLTAVCMRAATSLTGLMLLALVQSAGAISMPLVPVRATRAATVSFSKAGVLYGKLCNENFLLMATMQSSLLRGVRCAQR